MRRAHHVGMAEQRILGRRLLGEDVEGGAGHVPGIDRGAQRLLIDQSAARAIDDAHAFLHRRDRPGVNDSFRLLRERRVQGHEIRTPEQFGEIHLVHAELRRPLGREERIVGDHFHLQADRPVDHDRADIAAADHAERLVGDLHSHEAVLFPLAGLRGGVRLRDLPRECEHQRDRVLGRGDRIAERRIHDDHALGGRGGNVDVVDADTGAPDHLEPLRLLQNLGGDFGRRTDRQPVELTDDLRKPLFVGAELRLEIDLDAAILEDLNSGGRERIGDENVGGHGCFALSLSASAQTHERSPICNHHAAFGSASLLLAKAQSSHSVSASTSARSTVEPHHMRKPGGASRYAAMS